MSQQIHRPYTFDRTVRLVITALLFIVGLYFLYILRNVLLPFLVAWLIAYMLNPIVRFIKRKLHLAHGLAVVFTLLLVAGILTLLGFAIAPLIEIELWQINQLIVNYQNKGVGEQEGLAVLVGEFISEYINFEEIRNSLTKDTIVETIRYISPALQDLFSSTVSAVVSMTVIFIVLLYLIFILLDYDKINELWRLLIPPKYRPIVTRITNDVEHSMNKYFRHQAFICLILAVLYAIGFQIIGLPMAIVFGIAVGLMHMIPYMQIISFPVAALLCWLGAASHPDISFFGYIGLTALVYVIVQCIMDLFLVPRIMGKAMGLNPAIILLSLSVWGSLLGIVGMIIAIPLTTLLLSYYKEFLEGYDSEDKSSSLLNIKSQPPEDENITNK